METAASSESDREGSVSPLTDRLDVRLLSSTVGADENCQYATSFLINDAIAIDAGSVGLHPDLDRQAAVRHVLITHTHSDHIASLPVLLENTFHPAQRSIDVWGNDHVLACLQDDMFNNRIWPDLQTLSTPEQSFVHLNRLESEQPITIEGLRITPVDVDHTVPTLGFIIEARDRAVVIPSDTAPTQRIWELAAALPHVAAVFLEVSFPDTMAELAAASMHLTPSLFGPELEKLGRVVPVVAVHLKPRFREHIIAELSALDLANLQIGRPGKEYRW